MSISCFLFLLVAFTVNAIAAGDDHECVDFTVKNDGAYVVQVEFPDLGLMTIEKPYASTPCGEVELGVGNWEGDSTSYRIPKGTKILLDAVGKNGQKEFVAEASTDYVCRLGAESRLLECSETRRQ